MNAKRAQNAPAPQAQFEFKRPLDPHDDRSIWVDRNGAWRRILRHCEKKEWIALLGSKGIGKTSTLHWIRAQCGRDGLAAAPFLINLAELEGGNSEQAIQELVTELWKVASRKPEGFDEVGRALDEGTDFGCETFRGIPGFVAGVVGGAAGHDARCGRHRLDVSVGDLHLRERTRRDDLGAHHRDLLRGGFGLTLTAGASLHIGQPEMGKTAMLRRDVDAELAGTSVAVLAARTRG